MRKHFRTKGTLNGQRIGLARRMFLLLSVVFIAAIANMAMGGESVNAKAADANSPKSVSGEKGNVTWSIDVSTGIMTISPKPGTDGDLKQQVISGWGWYPITHSYNNSKAVKTINITGRIHAKNMNGMFEMFEAVTEINGIENIDTSQTTNMCRMFAECESLQSLDVSHFNTANVTDMSQMFAGCRSLNSLDISNFDTSNVTDMSSMFHLCWSLKALDVSNFNTSKVVFMNSMFYDCREITSLNLKNFNTSAVRDMQYMFSGCRSLTILNVSSFNTSKVINMECMFQDCISLIQLDLSNFNTSNVTNMRSMFGLFSNDPSSLTNLNVDSFNTAKVTDMCAMFNGLDSLTSLNISNFNTSNVTTMRSMFNGCKSLVSIDLNNFDTSKVTDMAYMFNNCCSLTSLDLSNFDTSKVTNMRCMFEMDECDKSSLHYINLSSFDTSAVLDKAKSVLMDKGSNYNYLDNPIYDVFSSFKTYSDGSYPFTIVFGKKCNTSVVHYNNKDYKFGIQYALPHYLYENIGTMHRKDLIIQQEENNFGPFDYYTDKSSDHSRFVFADAWKPEMAGTWMVKFKEEPSAQYTVTFNDGLTKKVISTVKAIAGNKVVLPTAPTHNGYEFVEWQNSDKLANVQSDVTVTAIYRKIEKPVMKYTVTFKDGLSNSVISSSTVEAGASISVPSAPSHDGYRFISWLNQNRLTNIQSDVVVTAQYEKIVVPVKHYKVTFIDSVTNKVIIERDAKEGDTVSAPEAPKHDGYVFVEWSNKDKMVNVSSDCKITAVYREIKQTNDNSNQANDSNKSDNTNSNAGNVNGNANIAANSNLNSHIEANVSNVNATNNNQMINDNQAENLIQTGINQFYVLIATFAAIFISFVAYRHRIDK